MEDINNIMQLKLNRQDYYAVMFETGYLFSLQLVNTLVFKVMCCGGAVGGDTVLQVGKSRVRFPVISLEFFIDIVFPAAL
jgi:hypothetical protein